MSFAVTVSTLELVLMETSKVLKPKNMTESVPNQFEVG